MTASQTAASAVSVGKLQNRFQMPLDPCYQQTWIANHRYFPRDTNKNRGYIKQNATVNKTANKWRTAGI
jgi:hypothetical protein